jgi:hypothetical protein
MPPRAPFSAISPPAGVCARKAPARASTAQGDSIGFGSSGAEAREVWRRNAGSRTATRFIEPPLASSLVAGRSRATSAGNGPTDLPTVSTALSQRPRVEGQVRVARWTAAISSVAWPGPGGSHAPVGPTVCLLLAGALSGFWTLPQALVFWRSFGSMVIFISFLLLMWRANHSPLRRDSSGF